MKVLVLVVTMTGTAEMIAEDLIEAHKSGHTFTLELAERSSAAALDQVSNLVVISSTYGTGDVPDPGKPLFDALAGKSLSHIRYGVISLGDSVYKETFAMGGLQWDRRLHQCGATRLAAPLLLDASGDADMSGLAVEWTGRWLDLLAGAVAGSRPEPGAAAPIT